MAKLLIFRGETQVQEHELKEQTVRIGRGTENDVVLEDPGKGVSRHHAEIRFEGGRYTLVDLQSQNGIWVSGSRVPSVVLEPGVTAALGPFRLMMPAPPPVSSIVAAPAIPADPATELTQMSSRTAAPLDLDSLSTPAAKALLPTLPETPSPKSTEKAPEAKPIIEKVPVAAAQKLPPVQKATPPPVQKSPVPRPVTQQKAWYADARILGTVAALLVIGLSAAIGYKVMRNGTGAAWDPTAAQQLIASGKCQEAVDTQITPALQKNPNDARALMLRDQCNKPPAPTPPTTTIPATPPVADNLADRLNEAETLLAGNVPADCQQALDAVNAVLTEDPNNDKAKDLAGKATACVNAPAARPTPPVATVDKPATPLSPAQGGLEVIQGETEKAYKARVAAMNKKYDDAVAVLASQKYQQALGLFNEIMSEVPSGYRELAQKRDEVRAGIRLEAKSTFDTGQAAENRGDLDTAMEQYRRARQLDPNPQYEAAYQRVTDRKLEAVRKKCNETLVDVAYNGANAEAVAALREAARVLPPNDACSVKAKDALKRLGK